MCSVYALGLQRDSGLYFMSVINTMNDPRIVDDSCLHLDSLNIL